MGCCGTSCGFVDIPGPGIVGIPKDVGEFIGIVGIPKDGGAFIVFGIWVGICPGIDCGCEGI
jgi:hypothetical protein